MSGDAVLTASGATAADGRSYWPADESVPLRDTTVGGLLAEAAGAVPDRVALVEGTPDPAGRRRWTFAELYTGAERLARALLGRFAPGEHVAVWSPNSAEWLLLEFAAALAGVTLVTVNPAFRAAELAHVLGHSRSAGLFLAPTFRGTDLEQELASVRPRLPELREVVRLDRLEEFTRSAAAGERLPEVRPESVAQLQYTSGTTGFPKGALLHHRGITNNARLLSERLGVEEGWVWLNQMPLFHTGGCVLSTLGPLQLRATQVLAPRFDPALTLHLIESEGVHVTGGVPTMHLAVIAHPDFARTDTSTLRAVSSGGSLVPADLVRDIEERLGVRYATMFGQTEAAPGITMTSLHDTAADKAQTVGTALAWTELLVVDTATGRPSPTDLPGELWVRSPMTMRGYFDSPAATAAAIDPAGWLHTGDLATMDRRGYCRIVGRAREAISRGGETVHPAEVEAVLTEHPGVREVAVLGVPDPVWGEQVAAVVCAADGRQPDPEELGRWLRERLASYKAPRRWAFTDRLPRTASGKVQKFLLREWFAPPEPSLGRRDDPESGV
jgi:fatty-acyl-CoA synthase